MSSRVPRIDSIEPSALLAGTTEPLRVIITGTNFLHPTVADYSTPSTDITAAAEAAAAVVQVKFGEVWTSDCKVKKYLILKLKHQHHQELSMVGLML
jgi:ATP/ADP translocase